MTRLFSLVSLLAQIDSLYAALVGLDPSKVVKATNVIPEPSTAAKGAKKTPPGTTVKGKPKKMAAAAAAAAAAVRGPIWVKVCLATGCVA